MRQRERRGKRKVIMKFRKFLGVSRTTQQAYFKEGVELLYPDQKCPLQIALLPAYDPANPDPTGWLPALGNEEENDFYMIVRAAKFVGHGNRRAKVSFLSPKTFDEHADDPYEAFYEYCSMTDRWSYLTKDPRGKRLTGEVEGAIIPRPKNFFVANVIDLSTGSRGGVFVTELSETVAKGLLYNLRKDGSRVDGIAFQRDEHGELVYGDITHPDHALGLEIAWGGKGYVVRPLTDDKGALTRVEIPSTLLQHRKHMEEPGTFLLKPDSPQAVVDKLAGLLRGYKSPDGYDELDALKEAIEFAYGKDAYAVDKNASDKPDDPFADAAEQTVAADTCAQAAAVGAAVDRGVAHEHYTPVRTPAAKAPAVPKAKPKTEPKAEVKTPAADTAAPGEDIDPSDIAAMRDLLRGGK